MKDPIPVGEERYFILNWRDQEFQGCVIKIIGEDANDVVKITYLSDHMDHRWRPTQWSRDYLRACTVKMTNGMIPIYGPDPFVVSYGDD